MRDDERRGFVREPTAIPLILQVELHGYDATDERFRAEGRTVNMSHGGLLARVNSELEPGTRCLSHFPSAVGQLGRTMIYGTVKRCRPAASGWEVAVAFDNPLLELDLPLPTPG